MLIRAFDLEQDLVQSCAGVYQVCENHVRNTHSPLEDSPKKQIQKYIHEVQKYLSLASEVLKSDSNVDFETLETRKKRVLSLAEESIDFFLNDSENQRFNPSNTQLYLRIILDTRDTAAVTHRIVRVYFY